jgi:predicted metal-dependent hydrolase
VELQKEELLFGEQLSLNTKETHYLQNKLQNLTTHSRSAILACYDDFYKYMAQEYITLRVVYFAQKMDLSFKEIRFKKMKSRWGSCSSARVLTFNTQLMKVNKELIDYVVVHELAHLVHMNHSQAFHSLVACYLHNHKDLRKQLKTHALV